MMWKKIFEMLNLEYKNVNVLMTDSPFSTNKHRTAIT